MTTPFKDWHVQPHGDLCEVEEGILTVVGTIRMPLGDLPRRMTVIRLRDLRLIIWSAIALDDKQMATIDAYGRPAFLVVPNDHHRLDAKAWKERYPNIEVVAPEGARLKVAETVPVNTSAPDFDDDAVEFITVPGTRQKEAALTVRTHNGVTLVLNDLVGNIRNAHGWSGWFLRLAGFAGKFAKIPRIVKWATVRDAQALSRQFLQWADMRSLNRILVSHGSPIESNPRRALRDLATSLT